MPSALHNDAAAFRAHNDRQRGVGLQFDSKHTTHRHSPAILAGAQGNLLTNAVTPTHAGILRYSEESGWPCPFARTTALRSGDFGSPVLNCSLRSTSG